MQIFPSPIEVSDFEGFVPEKDIFGRQSFGTNLTNLVSNVQSPLVILLDSQWGSGKTTFLKMWAGQLRNQGHSVIYFDAFENDYIDDAFIAIAGQIISLLKSKQELKKSFIDNFVDISAKVGSSLLRTTAKIGVKAATLGAINAVDLAEEINSVATDISNASSAYTDEVMKSILNRQQDEKVTLDKFKSALTELSKSELANTEIIKGNFNKSSRLIIILDELDRCKPLFALNILEIVKHLFSVDNVHFLISASLSQLQCSVKYAYGNEIDSINYLQKFYSLSVSFPEYDGGLRTRERYLQFLSNFFYNGIPRNQNTDAMIQLIQNVSDARSLSLRTIERIISVLKISLAMTDQNLPKIGAIVSGLCILKICDPLLFYKAKNGTLTYNEVHQALSFGEWRPKAVSSGEYTRNLWLYLTDYNKANDLPEELSRFPRLIGGLNFDRADEVVPWTAQFVVDVISAPS